MTQYEFTEFSRLKQLWASVLRMAVDDVMGCTVNRRTSRVLFSDKAMSWIWRNDLDASSMGSFEWVCAMLDMEPGRVREGIKQQLISRGRIYALERIEALYRG